MLPLLSALASAGPPVPPPPPPEEPPVVFVTTGDLGGIGGGTDAPTFHRDVPGLVSARVEVGWLVQDDLALYALDGRIASLAQLFDGDPVCTAAAPGHLSTRPTDHLLVVGDVPPWFEALEGRRREPPLWTCSVDGTPVAWLLSFDGRAGVPETWRLDGWETRRGLRLELEDGSTAWVLGVPQGEGTRRVTAIAREIDAGALFLDAGSFVDGMSAVREDDLSLHRPTGFQALRALGPTALVPGRTELVAGARAFLEEAEGLPYLGANWDSEDPALALPPVRVVAVDGRRVGIVGIVDPGLAAALPGLADEGIALTDPVAAVVSAFEGLEVDLRVVLGTLSPQVRHRLRRTVPSIDLVVGDPEADLLGIARASVALTRGEPWRLSAAPVIPLDGVVRTEVRFDGDEVVEVQTVPVPVTPEVPPDPATLARVTAVRMRTYPPLEHPLLPTPGDPREPMSADDFAAAICGAVLEATSADLVLLPELGAPRLPGPLSALAVADALALPDHVEVHRVPGDRFRVLLDRLLGLAPRTCGAPLAPRAPKVRGRAIEDDRVYRVVTTDRYRAAHPTVAALLDAAHGPVGLLDVDAVRPPPTEAATLRGVALSALESLRTVHGEGLFAALTTRDPSRKDPQWLLRVRHIQLRTEGFTGVDDPVYADIPETLATSPSSFTVGAAGDVALDYSDAGLIWDVRVRSVLTRLTTDGETLETADDLKVSTSLTLPGVATPEVAGVSFRPYSEVLYDGELTAVVGEDGVRNPLQRDLSYTVGLAASRHGVLRALRAGGFGLVDLSRPDKAPEVGGRLEVETRVGFGPRLGWTTLLDAFVYGATADDDTSDMRFKARLDSRLELPLSAWLDLAVYGTGFAFAGRVPQTRAPAASYSVGIALDLGGVFAL